jgi:hypothetical protein
MNHLINYITNTTLTIIKMKKNSIVSLALSAILFASCSPSLVVPIDKNKLITDCVIEFKDQNLTVKQNDVFLLSALGLKANSKVDANVTAIENAAISFKKGKVINYPITIKNSNYTKPYYGRIAFFNTSKNNEMAAVSRYREISVSNSYFDAATRGRIAIMYEYIDLNNGLGGNQKIPTWIIIMSDEPI